MVTVLTFITERGGNNKVMRLVIDAMKLTPANPSLIDCRNAIIQADLNTTNGQDYCMIWETLLEEVWE